MIFCNCIFLIWAGKDNKLAIKIEDFCMIFYISEMSLKIIGFGFYKNNDSYIRSNYNIMDFSIILIYQIEKAMKLSSKNIYFVIHCYFF